MAKFTRPRPVDVLRILTLNTWFLPPLKDRRLEMIAWINAVDPHIVCLQEVRQEADEATLAHRLAELCDGDWSVAYGGMPEESGILSGNAVMSRWPIAESETYPLECADRRPKLLLFVRTGGFDVFCAHLTSSPKGAVVRERQVMFIDDIISSRSDDQSLLPPILAGDFNAPPGASAMRFLRGESGLEGRSTFFQDAWAVSGDGPGITWDHRNPHTPPAYLFDHRCDYVFVGVPKVPLGWSGGGNPNVVPSGQVVNSFIACDSALTGTHASDHYAVVADIRTPSMPEI